MTQISNDIAHIIRKYSIFTTHFAGFNMNFMIRFYFSSQTCGTEVLVRIE